MKIRTATPADAPAIRAIYAPYVENTAITFEYVVPTEEEMCTRIEHTLKKYPYLVAEEGGEIVGYAYAGVFKERAAYSRCVETSIYVAMDKRNRGVGKALYAQLEDELAAMGVLNVNACITWTDEPCQFVTHQSPDFHARLGYVQCAHFHQCGYKFDRWFDMIWMEKMIGEHK